MKTNGAGRWIRWAICLCAGTVFAGEAPPPLVLRVFGDFYDAADLGLSASASGCRELEPLTKAIIGPLFADYCEKTGIAVGEEDLKEYCRRQLPAGASFIETWAEWAPNGNRRKARQEASARLAVWKLQKSLFEKYGGQVARSEGFPPQAFDAMCAYVAEREEAGDFVILDRQLRIRFWECFRTPKSPLVPADAGRALIEEHPADRQNRGPQAEP